MYTLSHLSSELECSGFHKKGIYTVLSFSARPCVGLGALPMVFCVALLTVDLLSLFY